MDPKWTRRAPATTPGPVHSAWPFSVSALWKRSSISAPGMPTYRLPTIARMPGAIAARKLVNRPAGWAKHVVLYEFLSAEAHHENFMAGHESLRFPLKASGTNRVVKYNGPMRRAVPSIGERIWPAGRVRLECRPLRS